MLKHWLPAQSIQLMIRRTWRRQILPAFVSRDRVQMLAALVIANTCLDELLIAYGWQGSTEAERVHNARGSFSDYSGVRAARRLRNLAVHHIDFSLNWEACGAALASLSQALRDHGVDLDEDLCDQVDAKDNAVLPSSPKDIRVHEAVGEYSDPQLAAINVRAAVA